VQVHAMLERRDAFILIKMADLGVFSCVGLDPTAHRYLLLKSRMYCRPVFVPLCAGIVECDSPGVTSSDYSLFPFQRIKHPVYPLDAL
jgi:microcystin degradation protein MlrC